MNGRARLPLTKLCTIASDKTVHDCLRQNCARLPQTKLCTIASDKTVHSSAMDGDVSSLYKILRVLIYQNSS